MAPAGSSKYKPGDRVKVRKEFLSRHHRTPGYIKGRLGTVAVLCGIYRNPEERAYGASGLPKLPLYRVEFDQTQIWPGYTEGPHDKLYTDIYEHWLEPA